MWKGSLSFGLVAIPVKLFSATEEKGLKFNLLHAADHGRVKYQRTCTKGDHEVPWEETVRGYEYEKGNFVVLTDDELERGLDPLKIVDVVQFVPIEEIDPIYFRSSYYLVPEAQGLKAYRLLEKALSESGLVGIVKVAFRDKEHLAVLRVRDDVFMLETMYWPDEIRSASFEELDKKVQVRDQELEMAKALVENLSDHFDPAKFKDTYRERLESIIEKKIAGEEVETLAEEQAPKVLDLMEALKASVEATAAPKQDRSAAAKRRKTKSA